MFTQYDIFIVLTGVFLLTSVAFLVAFLEANKNLNEADKRVEEHRKEITEYRRAINDTSVELMKLVPRFPMAKVIGVHDPKERLIQVVDFLKEKPPK